MSSNSYMSRITRQLIKKCSKESPWHFGNKVLYDLCRNHPDHRDKSVVIAKIWLIGRAYAAVIERRKNKEGGNGDFYLEEVAPKVCKSKIDTWIENASVHRSPSLNSITKILSAHGNLTALFNDISGLEKRSLASKYLHFHKPNLFFIYDTRAVAAMRKLSDIAGHAVPRDDLFDNEYHKFTNKCISLRDRIKKDYGVTLNPRQIDNLLLEIYSENK